MIWGGGTPDKSNLPGMNYDGVGASTRDNAGARGHRMVVSDWPTGFGVFSIPGVAVVMDDRGGP